MAKNFGRGYDGKRPPEGTSEEVEFNTGNSFKDITMCQLHKVIKLSNVEFRGGFYTSITSPAGNDKEIYIQDSREVFSNACFALALLLKPKFDKTMEDEYKVIKENIQNITKKFIDSSSPDEEVVLGDSFYESDKDKIFLETYKNKKLLEYINLLASISAFLSRINYMDILGGSY